MVYGVGDQGARQFQLRIFLHNLVQAGNGRLAPSRGLRGIGIVLEGTQGRFFVLLGAYGVVTLKVKIFQPVMDQRGLGLEFGQGAAIDGAFQIIRGLATRQA